MALTFTFTPDSEGDGWESVGNDRARLGTLGLVGTYTAPGGDVIPAAAGTVQSFADLFGMSRVDKLEIIDGCTSGGAVPRFVDATRKLELRGAAAGATGLTELANAAAVGGQTVRVRVTGK